MMNWYSFTRALFTVALYMLVGTAFSQEESFCDPLLISEENTANGYQMRDNRCEGIYIREVSSSSAITLVSFVDSLDFTLDTASDLQVSWNLPDDTSNSNTVIADTETIRLRSESVVRKLYYRMDTRVSINKGFYDWPTNVLTGLDLTKEKIGVFSWLPVTFNSQNSTEAVKRDVYFPPLIVQQGKSASTSCPKDPPSGAKCYQIQVIPQKDLDELSYYVANSPEGYPNETVIDKKALEYGYYPSGRPIVFPLVLEQKYPSGYYYLELIADPEQGEESTLPIWFYHARN
jgi:hypothetical protein